MSSKPTKFMQMLERADPQRRQIREILIETFQEFPTFEEAANHIGITRQTFSSWWYRLNCHETMQEEPEVA